MTPSAEILVVGTELLGRKRDLNGPRVARALAARGVLIRGLQIVPDDIETLGSRIRHALAGGGLVVTLGGLGPTADDVTREGLGAATGLAMVEDAATRERIASWYARRDRTPNALTWRQALVPEGARVIANVTGMAAGAVLTASGTVIAMLPGPPGELEAMLDATLDVVMERLRAAGHEISGPPHSVELLLCGIGESDAAVRVTALPEVDGLDLAWLPHPGQVRLILSGDAARVRAACDAIRPVLGESIVSEDGRGLPEVIVATLAAREESVAAAESCTGGLVSAALTSVAGSSAVVRAGIVAYANDAKVELLGVPAALLAEKGAVSEEVAMAMATGMRKAGSADWGLGVTGIAGPSGGSAEKPVGLVFIAVAAPDGRRASRRLQLHGSREDIRSASTSALLDLLRRSL